MFDYLERFRLENPTLWNSFEYCTKEFQPVGEVYTGRVLRIDQFDAATLNVEFPPSHLVFFMFVYLKKFDYEYQPMEKILWEISFEYRDAFFYFTVRKFGFKLISSTEDRELIKDLLKKINSAIKIVDDMMSPLLMDIVNEGDITFQNQSHFLYQRYIYFKNKVTEIYQKKEDKNEDRTADSRFLQSRVQIEKEAFYNIQAMLDAYFSYQEHLLILLYPFGTADKRKYSVSELITEDWSSKFNEIFHPSKHSEMMKHYAKLKSIKEMYRNKYAHGGFEKNNGSLFAKVDGLGFIPIQVNKAKSFSFFHINDVEYQEICTIINGFENHLTTSKYWSRPIKLIQSGLDIYFDEFHIRQYKNAVKSDEDLEIFIFHELEMEDRYTNMDW